MSFFFFFKQKTEYELRISDWSSDVCSSDLVPSYIEKTSAGAYYMAGTPDGSRPGIFYFNSYDLPSRTTPGMETLYLHEAVPGLHFQISLAQENDELPNFLRFDGNTAYVEGWALYSESLGRELGLLPDRSEEHTSELQSL